MIISQQCISLYYFLSKSRKISATSYQSTLFYTPPPPPFSSLSLLSCASFIFFSSTSFSMSYLNLIRQPSVPSGSSFLNVMMNKDFQGFWSYSGQLSNIKCKCIRQVVVDLSGRSRRHSQIATYATELFLENSEFKLTLLCSRSASPQMDSVVIYDRIQDGKALWARIQGTNHLGRLSLNSW